MNEQLFAQLFDFGALGIFATFLIWQHLGMQRRLDALVDGFQSQLKDIERSHEDRIEIMRERYDVVITGIRKECREEREAIEEQRDKLQAQIQELILSGDQKLDKALEKLDLGLETMMKKYEEERVERLARSKARE